MVLLMRAIEGWLSMGVLLRMESVEKAAVMVRGREAGRTPWGRGAAIGGPAGRCCCPTDCITTR